MLGMALIINTITATSNRSLPLRINRRYSIRYACWIHILVSKMTGHMLNERLGKWTFWIFMSGFNICFFPMYLGLDGMTRRMYTYSESLGWGWLNQIASVGAVMMGIGFLLLCYNVIWCTSR